MPLIRTSERRRFSDAGPYPQVLATGGAVAVMLLCLRNGQRIDPPASDAAETVFSVLDGEGFVVDGEDTHPVRAGDVVHVPAGRIKALLAGEGDFSVLGVRTMGGRRG